MFSRRDYSYYEVVGKVKPNTAVQHGTVGNKVTAQEVQCNALANKKVFSFTLLISMCHSFCKPWLTGRLADREEGFTK